MSVPHSATEYERHTTHSRNPLARFSHRARTSKALALVRQFLPERGAILDFGCASGEFLRQVRQQFPAAQLYGLDPFSLPGEGYTHLRAVEGCGLHSFELITAFEVLEHLNEGAAEQFYRLVSGHLSSGGVCIASAPNMLGPALILKLLHGVLSGGSALNYTAGEAARAVFFTKSPSRLPANRAGTMRHKGYDWRKSRNRIASEFDIVSETFTPLGWAWWGFNSQWFCVFRPRQCE